MAEPDSLRAEVSKLSGEDLAAYADAQMINTKNTPGQSVRHWVVWEEIAKRLRGGDEKSAKKHG